MGHNYSPPETTSAKLTRLLARIPDNWHITIERHPDCQKWTALTEAPDKIGEGKISAMHPDPASALEESWKLNRTEENKSRI
ncbi:MAG: hypothetical protein LKH33_08855 [Acetobacter sp.]|jgi:hypothetical protein|nr:hypothetical protein [Acetobacter sp.]MCH4060685.1 hypothetical protein [Acetobacter sp.]MCH4087625.1 hypothetical protein [Acetobacter sp.]MCI1294253.1 hypothetical protein [Acetobacter sp.]MCI1320838.1 hypothetical protein [Acetobacter sp.]